MSAEPFSARVIGTPAPQGSKRHVGNGRMVESSAQLAPWRETVAATVAERMAAIGHEGYAQHVALVGVFEYLLHRPETLPRRHVHPARRPDLDKLLRATLDGLTTSGLLHDDAQLVRITAAKSYAEGGQATGVRLVLMVER